MSFFRRVEPLPVAVGRIGRLVAGTAAVLLAVTASVAAADPAWKPALRRAQDLNPDPDVVEVRLTAAETVVDLWPGSRTRMWTYNGTFPGPLIEAKLGDRIIVHFTNLLPEPTTVHWHGVDAPAAMDGSNISQGEVPTGGTFRYEFRALGAALYWYHPHRRTNEQVERGLYGPLLIRDPEEDRRIEMDRVEEHVLLVDDILLDEEGQLQPFVSDPDAVFSPPERAERLLNGREGNVFLVNGRRLPTLRLKAGVPQRWRVLNAANARTMLLSIPGQVLQRIGGDQGLLDRPESIPPVGSQERLPPEHATPLFPSAGLLLLPGERADVVFVPGEEPGPELRLEWHDFGRGRHGVRYGPFGELELLHPLDDGFRPVVPLMRLRLTGGGGAPPTAWSLPTPLRATPLPEVPAVPGVTETIPVFFGHSLPDAEGDVTFFAAVRDADGLLEKVHDRLPASPAAFGPMPFARVDAPAAPEVAVGEVRIWEVVNFTGGDHPFHTHGFPFQLIDYQWTDLDNPQGNFSIRRPFLETKDTIRIPRRQGLLGRSWVVVRLAVRFDDTRHAPGLRRAPEAMVAFGKTPGEGFSGGWLAHCHILEHSTLGMMTFFQLVLP